MNQPAPSQTIRVLPPETAKRIAAGEVIERPQSVLRELLDNSIDAAASQIRVNLKAGGLDELSVEDNGCGMGREDLELCVLPHATSKIGQLDDLLALRTLGFRGEALASIAAVARLSIRSAVADDTAWELESGPGLPTRIIASRGSRGTRVQVSDLFANFPARRQFMQRAAAESLACRQVFVDKALPFPDRGFQLGAEGRPSLSLLPDSLTGRVHQAALPSEPAELLRELQANAADFSIRLVAAAPDLQRRDRRFLQVFVNRRRVQEFRLQQAIEYAYREVLPGGVYPVAFAFIDVDPALADFNIHPAKKEVRLRNADELRQAIKRCLGDYFRNSFRLNFPSQADTPRQWHLDTGVANDGLLDALRSAREDGGAYLSRALLHSPARLPPEAAAYPAAERTEGRTAETTPTQQTSASPAYMPEGPGQPVGLRYLGQGLGTFLIFEYQDELVILDQHAAHERILYNQLCTAATPSQELLVPYVYEPASDAEDRLLERMQPDLAEQGFSLSKEGQAWVLNSLPAILDGEDSGLLFTVIRQTGAAAAVLHQLRAQIACKAAVKDGQALDPATATALARAALDLPEARCPHGRPIWLRLSRQQLFTAVGRS